MEQVDLIFINWNSADLLFAAARTLEQTSLPYRICVVDNGSADDSCAQIRSRLPQAELIEMGYNAGFAAAVNAGLNAAQSRYALILNTDIEFKNDVPALLIDALKQYDAALACPELHRPDGSLQAAVVPEPTLFTELTNRSIARRFLHYDQQAPSLVKSIVGPCMAVDIEKLRALGFGQNGQFFDQRFFFFFEETDFCRRIVQAGGRIVYQPQAHLMHMQGESANKRPVGARVQFQESRYKYFRKHYGIAAVALLFAGTLLRTLVNALVQTLAAAFAFGRKPNKAWDKACVYWMLTLWHLLLCKPRWSFDKR
ncbi:MAG: glycosyltransferase [Neisseria sp.]|uniref:glycosyltransferase family 2 protein n=1 Tax=Neisseria sp. TaxID=192066 RepID=UPI0026DB84B8|nr:glycosyltransferase [Neisseria sp.]MDO4641520.1 glycosyltransferase [Neisseria sp.]